MGGHTAEAAGADLTAGDRATALAGSKLWITNGGEAGIFLVFATVDSSKGYKGITCFAVDKAEAGGALVIGKVRGARGASLAGGATSDLASRSRTASFRAAAPTRANPSQHA